MRYRLLLAALLMPFVAPSARAEAPPGLREVPADAVFFAHADVPKLWNSAWGVALRQAFGPVLDGELVRLKEMGFPLADLETATFYMPHQTFGRRDVPLGVLVLRSRTAFDAAKVAAFDRGLPKGDGVSAAYLRDERTCVIASKDLLDDLKQGYVAKPRNSLMAPYLELAVGKALTVAGNVTAVPRELRQDVPPDAREYLGLLDAKTAAVTLDAGKTLTLDFVGVGDNDGDAASLRGSLEAAASLARSTVRQGVESKDKLADPFRPILRTVSKSLEALEFNRDKTVVRGHFALPMDFELGTPVAEGVKQMRAAAARMKSANNLKQVVLALHNYHDAMGKLPAAAICDKAGKPLLSWRVAILPYIEQDALYRQFKLNEPWDSVHNKKLLAQMPPTYLLPGDDAKAFKTRYRVFHGQGALFDLDKGVGFAQITDGLSNTVAVFDAAEAVEWSRPADIEYDPKADPKGHFRFVNGVGTFARADGSVGNLREKVSREMLHAFITRAGGEVLSIDD